MMATERVSELDREYGERMLHTYRALKTFNMAGVDFDFGPRVFSSQHPPITTAEDALEILLELSISGGEPRSPFGDYMRAKARASLVYTQAVSGRFYPLSEYLGRTLGLTAKAPTDSEIDAQREIVIGRFSNLIEKPYNASGWESFFERFHLGGDDLRQAVFQAQATLDPIMGDILGLGPDFQYETDFIAVKDYWLMWSSGEHGSYLKRVNEHSINQPRWFRGQEEALTSHENTHLMQAHLWRRNIMSGQISPGYGITTVPGPEQVGCEGVAVVLPYLIPEIWDRLSEFGKFAVERTYLSHLVYGKAHWDINTTNPNRDEISDFIRFHLPCESQERIDDQLVKRRSSPRHRSYLYAYMEGARWHRRIAEHLPPDLAIELIRKECERPLLFRQLKDVADVLPKPDSEISIPRELINGS